MYDIIGDIHGHADELKVLLEKMEYRKQNGHFSHPSRKVVFLGDFIDRGPQIKKTLDIVMPMVDSGAALSVMGNHEWNAIAFHTNHPTKKGEYLREHSSKNAHQHIETLKQLSAYEICDFLTWAKNLPLWLDLDGFRVVHACWSPAAINAINIQTNGKVDFTSDFFVQANTKDTPEYNNIEIILKGKEISLPEGKTFKDKDDHERKEVRVKWYNETIGETYGTMGMSMENSSLFNDIIPDSALENYQHEPYASYDKPVFVGHYWQSDPAPSLLKENVACLDYSVAKGGFLCAYQWDDTKTLTNDDFVVADKGVNPICYRRHCSGKSC